MDTAVDVDAMAGRVHPETTRCSQRQTATATCIYSSP
jgi:hypothetical protein